MPSVDDRILETALRLFCDYGLARTSMSEVARQTPISRPALYKRYANKDAQYCSVVDTVLDRATQAAGDELHKPGPLGDRLDQFLQRAWGDLAEPALMTTHGMDMLDARHNVARRIVEMRALERRQVLRTVLTDETGIHGPTVDRWCEIITMAPPYLIVDRPTVAAYRERLRSFAQTFAAGITVTATDG